jgi:hypothetical protein
LVATSRTRNAWLRSTSRRHRAQVTSVAHTRADLRQVQVTWVGAVLAVLVGLTTCVVASVSISWVPVYLVLMVVILVTPRPARRSKTRSKSAGNSTGSIHADLDHGIRADQMAEVDRHFPSPEPEAGLELVTAPADSLGHGLDSTGPDLLKPRRTRARARKLARTGTEPAMISIPVAWIRVGPGKFIRADANTSMVDPVQSERPDEIARPPTSARPEVDPRAVDQSAVLPVARGFDPTTDPADSAIPALAIPVTALAERDTPDLAETPTDQLSMAVEFDRVLESLTDAHGITPSAVGEIPGASSPVEQLNGAEPEALGGAENDFSLNGAGSANTDGRVLDFRRRSLAQQAFKERVDLVSRWTAQAMPNTIRASSRRVLLPRFNPRTSVSLSLAVNLRAQQAMRRAFGRISHVHRTVCSRSPPYRWSVAAGLGSTWRASPQIRLRDGSACGIKPAELRQSLGMVSSLTLR